MPSTDGTAPGRGAVDEIGGVYLLLLLGFTLFTATWCPVGAADATFAWSVEHHYTGANITAPGLVTLRKSTSLLLVLSPSVCDQLCDCK